MLATTRRWGLCALLALGIAGCGKQEPSGASNPAKSSGAQDSALAAVINRFTAAVNDHKPEDARDLFFPDGTRPPEDAFKRLWDDLTRNPYYGQLKAIRWDGDPPRMEREPHGPEMLAIAPVKADFDSGGKTRTVAGEIVCGRVEGAWKIGHVRYLTPPEPGNVKVDRSSPAATLESVIAAARQRDTAALNSLVSASDEGSAEARVARALRGEGKLGDWIKGLQEGFSEPSPPRFFLGKAQGGGRVTSTMKMDPGMKFLQTNGALEVQSYFLMMHENDSPRPRGICYIVFARFESGWQLYELIAPWTAK